MGLFKRLFGLADKQVPELRHHEAGKPVEHAVLLHFRLDGEGPTPDEMTRYHGLQDELSAAIAAEGAGDVDGDEWGGGECVVYTYGPDAERLWKAMEPVLAKYPFPAGSFAVKRFGGPSEGREETVDMGWAG